MLIFHGNPFKIAIANILKLLSQKLFKIMSTFDYLTTLKQEYGVNEHQCMHQYKYHISEYQLGVTVGILAEYHDFINT